MHSRAWVKHAIQVIEADFNRSADTHLVPLPLPAFPDIHLYLKDESSHPTGSLKHRLARSLFLYALCNGWIGSRSTIIEASSGSTAVSEAYFARLLNLPFIAVMPRSTSPEKIACIEFYGGRCHLVDDAAEVIPESHRLARETGGHFMDQFTYAERATDWRSNNNIAESVFGQMREEMHPIPSWIVCGAGTGGTSATFGRYVRYRRFDTEVCVADPEHSIFLDYYLGGDPMLSCAQGSRIEGIGRPRVEPSFVREVIDAMVKVPDACSLAALRYLESALGRRCGGSTGTIFCAMLSVAARMDELNQAGSVVGILCDGGERYLHSYYSSDWLARNGIDIGKGDAHIRAFASRAGQQWHLPLQRRIA
ncbi:MAG: PLP-dependent cysteine synthase family protein [Noviherbaspirillum sp.]|nr:PLP-dependent cysteine synthase family protein [Noviherbaspirillum sp.]MDB5795772.1 PLP-dependent cysteine synthase family protein [Noviherbaspirillum sp.]